MPVQPGSIKTIPSRASQRPRTTWPRSSAKCQSRLSRIPQPQPNQRSSLSRRTQPAACLIYYPQVSAPRPDSKMASFCQILIAAPLLAVTALAQNQNPSPMVEHTRPHPRLKQTALPGRHVSLSIGDLYVPIGFASQKAGPLIIHFHGAPWLPQQTAAKNQAVLAIQLGSGSSVYAKPFLDRQVFPNLLKEAQAAAGRPFSSITLTAWSAGYG